MKPIIRTSPKDDPNYQQKNVGAVSFGLSLNHKGDELEKDYSISIYTDDEFIWVAQIDERTVARLLRQWGKINEDDSTLSFR